MIKYPKLQDHKWLETEVQEKPLRQIAEEVRCSYSAVMYQVKKQGIDVPHRTKHRFNPHKSAAVRQGLKRKYPNGRFGSSASNWRGGKRRASSGGKYVYIYCPGHPDATKAGCVMEHRLVAEEMIGRRLQKNEVPHHKNGIKDDNRPENLAVLTRSEHVQLHFDAIKEVYRLRAILDEKGINY